jgi:hypothetical protein
MGGKKLNNSDIITNANNLKGKMWVKRKCRQCETGEILVHIEWDNPPRLCDICKARKTHKKERGLRVYIESKKKKTNQKDEDIKELEELLHIENKLNELNKKYRNDEIKVFEDLIKIKKVRDILIDWDKSVRKSMAGSKKREMV